MRADSEVLTASRAAARARAAGVLLAAGFLAVIAGVPLLDAFAGMRRERPADESRWPLTAALGEWLVAAVSGADAGTASARVESTIEERSTVGAWALAQGQAALVAGLGAGTDKVLRGRDGWLFFRPAVESVTGRAFLDLPRPQGVAAVTRARPCCASPASSPAVGSGS